MAVKIGYGPPVVDPKQTRPGERPDPESASQTGRPGDEPATEQEQKQRARFRRMFTELIDSGQAFRSASQEIVSGVAQGTKEEVMRIVSAEVRGFLDKMDVVDLFQDIVSGLVIDVKTEVRFSRGEDGKLEPQVKSAQTKVRTKAERAEQEADGDD